MNTPEPLTAEEERLLRFARSINGGLLDAGPVETIDRLIATLDRERDEHAALREKARATLDYLADWVQAPGEQGRHPHAESLVHALRAALDEVKG